MLCVDPWRELLPSGSRTKENAMLVMKNFTQLDMVFIDGDPNMLPWHEEALRVRVRVRVRIPTCSLGMKRRSLASTLVYIYVYMPSTAHAFLRFQTITPFGKNRAFLSCGAGGRRRICSSLCSKRSTRKALRRDL